MVNNFQANKATCPDGHEYLVNYQSAECPHERFVDIMDKPDRLLTISEKTALLFDGGRFRAPNIIADEVSKAQDAKSYKIGFEEGYAKAKEELCQD